MGELVSIVVPVYNAERFLEECIHSILAQTYTNIELLLVDDGSTDSSVEICKKFADSDKRVCYFESAHEGVSVARNKGIEQAKGKYICFVDSDDLLESDFVETLYSEIQKNEVEIVFCNYQYLYSDKKIKKNSRIDVGHYTFRDVANIAIDDGTITGILFGSVWGAIYNLDSIRKHEVSFDCSIKRNEDGLFNLCLLKQISAFYVTDYDGYLYRQWRKAKKKDFVIDGEVKKATEKIRECCSEFDDLEKQLKCRNVSAVFWNAMSISKTNRNFFSTCSFLKKYLADHPISDDCECLNMTRINRYKKVLITMLRKRQVCLFVFSLRYLYPMLKSVLKR